MQFSNIDRVSIDFRVIQAIGRLLRPLFWVYTFNISILDPAFDQV